MIMISKVSEKKKKDVFVVTESMHFYDFFFFSKMLMP